MVRGESGLPRAAVRSLLSHHRHALIPRADLVRGGREIQRCAALVSAAAGNHQPLGTGYDVTLAKCRIAFDCNGGETDLVLPIAGASRDQLVAIAKRIRQFGIGLAVLGCGVVDIAAIDDFGFARRAKSCCMPPRGFGCRRRVPESNARRRCARNTPASRRRNSRRADAGRFGERRNCSRPQTAAGSWHAAGRHRTRRTMRRKILGRGGTRASTPSAAATPGLPAFPASGSSSPPRRALHLKRRCRKIHRVAARGQRGHDGRDGALSGER